VPRASAVLKVRRVRRARKVLLGRRVPPVHRVAKALRAARERRVPRAVAARRERRVHKARKGLLRTSLPPTHQRRMARLVPSSAVSPPSWLLSAQRCLNPNRHHHRACRRRMPSRRQRHSSAGMGILPVGCRTGVFRIRHLFRPALRTPSPQSGLPVMRRWLMPASSDPADSTARVLGRIRQSSWYARSSQKHLVPRMYGSRVTRLSRCH
jgi:hypothetical protein